MTMKTISGGSKVEPGFYWHMKGWEIVPVSDTQGTLPGTEKDRYLRVPTPALLVLAPVMGASFVMFLPFIGFAMLGQFLWKKATLALSGPGQVATQPADPRS
jgi:hypothetical protein